MNAGEPRPIRTFGRVRARSLKPAQAQLLTTLLPRIAIPPGPFDPRPLSPAPSKVWLEIGFGGGEHLAARAEQAPDVLFLGAEPFINGVASALRHVNRRSLANVRLYPGDGRDLIAALPPASIDRLIILFPDPWPKRRHRKRRLVEPGFLVEAARVLKPGGRVLFATDWADYVETALVAFLASSDFEWLAEAAADWRVPPADHATTRYEQKALGDCAPVWLQFRRL